MADQPPPPPPRPPKLPVPAKPVPAVPVPPVVAKTPPPQAVVVPKAIAVPPVVPKPAPAKPAAAKPTPAKPAPATPQRPKAVVDVGGETAEPVTATAAKPRARDPGASTASVGMPGPTPPTPRPTPPPPAAKPPTPAPSAAAPGVAAPATAGAPATPATAGAAGAPATPAAPAGPVPAVPVAAVAVKVLKTPARLTGPDPLIGRLVARCKIEERIGEGKTSVVYRATHTALGMKVAVKILHPEVLEFPEIVQKFENEARAIARLDHANVLKIYDVSAEGDVHGIVMELLEGESVLDLLDREERLPAVDSLRILRQAAAGLEAAHAKKIIHRDVKPQNLVVLPDGTVKLVDFGLATAPDSDMAASRIGTPHYMAPEVCEAKPAEPESDVYSLGISLYHCLVGTPPYAGKTVKEILAAHVEGKPLHPEWRVPGIPKALCELVRDMTKRDPLTRMSMRDVIENVDKIGGDELAASPRLSSRRGRVRSQSGPPVAAIVGGIVLLIGILAIVFTQSGGGGSTPAKPSGGGSARGPGEPAETPTDAGRTPGTSPAAGTSPAPSAPVVAPPTPPVDAPPPPETDEQRKEREEKERAARKTQSETAMKEVEDFARLHETDKVGVVRAYRQVASTFKGTEIAKEARRRADLIDKGQMHPNPDKTFTAPDRVAEAAAKWDKARAMVDQALTTGAYAEAEGLIPEAVDDPQGTLSEDLVFWRRLATDCRGFRAGLKRFAPDLKAADRDVNTPKGAGRLIDASESGLQVEVGSEVLDVQWDQFDRRDLFQLATRAFKGKGDAYGAMLVSYAFVHRLRDEFWQYAVGRSLGGEDGAHVSRALARADARFPK